MGSTGHSLLKTRILILSLLLTAVGLPGSAQTQQCQQLSEQLLTQLDDGPTASIDTQAEEQRMILRSRGCDPQRIGYNYQIEAIKLNQQLDARPKKKKRFRLDKIIRISY